MSVSRVLVVDDSSFFRKRLSEIFDSDSHIEVIGSASNGKEAITLVERLRPDVITMDIEMPIMDGITAVKNIMKSCPTPILMFSSLTTEGAKATLDALDAGAVDFLPKSLSDISDDKEVAKRQLCARVRVVSARGIRARGDNKINYSRESLVEGSDAHRHKLRPITDHDFIIIGTSTGGPAAIQTILARIPPSFRMPIIIIQHMPESFTGPFSDRLDKLCTVNVSLASDGELIQSGNIYIAPGGHQLTFNKGVNGRLSLSVKRSDSNETYKPSVDVTFKSAAELTDANVAAFILTGMGSDGKEGARALKSKGATIITQDEESSIVYGMPMVVKKAGLSDAELSLGSIATLISGVS